MRHFVLGCIAFLIVAPFASAQSYAGSWGAGEEYAYEALNFADGRHTAQQSTDDLAAEYGPVPVELVVEYLQALKRIGIVE